MTNLISPIEVSGPRHYPADAVRNAVCRLSYRLIMANTAQDPALSLLYDVFDKSGLLTSEEVLIVWRECVVFATTPTVGSA